MEVSGPHSGFHMGEVARPRRYRLPSRLMFRPNGSDLRKMPSRIQTSLDHLLAVKRLIATVLSANSVSSPDTFEPAALGRLSKPTLQDPRRSSRQTGQDDRSASQMIGDLNGGGYLHDASCARGWKRPAALRSPQTLLPQPKQGQAERASRVPRTGGHTSKTSRGCCDDAGAFTIAAKGFLERRCSRPPVAQSPFCGSVCV